METKKAKIEIEFGRDELAGTMMLVGKKPTDKMWQALTEKPIVLDCSIAGEDAVRLKIALIALVVQSFKKNK